MNITENNKMATPMEIKQTISHFFEEALTEFKDHIRKLTFVQRINDFEFGEFNLPLGCVKSESAEVQSLYECFASWKEQLILKGLLIQKLCSNQHSCIAVHLDRAAYFKSVISSVLLDREKYGHCERKGSAPPIVVNNVGKCTELAESNIPGRDSLDVLRSLLVQEHSVKLLEANGFSIISQLRHQEVKGLADIEQYIDLNPKLLQQSPQVDVIELQKSECVKQTLCSSHVTSIEQGARDLSVDDTSSPTGVKWEGDTSRGSYTFDCRSFIKENGLKSGKTDYDHNLGICEILNDGRATKTFAEAISMYNSIQELKPEVIAYIIDQSSAFSQQKVMLILHQMLRQASLDVKQHIIVFGPVAPMGPSESANLKSAVEYLRMRHSDLKQAAVMKYGDAVDGDAWETTIRALTTACVKLEILSTIPRNQLKLDLCSSHNEDGVYVSTGSFVMYNCARLATLFEHFQQAVLDGTYPDLPELEEVDFSMLKEEQEWELLFAYVATFPDLVKQTVEDFITAGSMTVSIHTHKVCQMLGTLCRCLSSYYSRFHILGESRDHLYPQMFARLYLLKAVHQVMVNSLHLLSITPQNQL